MNKFVKISLVASLAIAGISVSASAGSLEDALSQGKFSGDIKSYYFVQSFEGAGKNDSSIWVNGGHLKYISGSLNGVSVGATLQASSVNDIDDEDGKTKSTMDAQGAQLSESYINYKISNTSIKAGRQFIVGMPLLGRSGSRMIKDSFEAYLLTNTDLENTTILAGKVTKYQGRTDFSGHGAYTTLGTGTGAIGDFLKVGTDGTDTIYVKNTSIKNLTLRGQYLGTDSVSDVLYVDAKYQFIGDLKPYLAVQYYDTDYDSSTTDSSLYGVKVGASVSGVNLFAAYSSTDDEGSVDRGLGQGAYSIYTASVKTAGGDAYKAGTDSWTTGASYTFANSLNARVQYSNYDQPTANADLDELNFTFKYKFSGELKNLSARIDYTILDYDDDSKDATDFRSKLIYSF